VGTLSGSEDVWCHEDDAFARELFAWTPEDIERQKGMAMPNVFVGVDVGQKHDPTTIAVCEPDERDVGGQRAVFFQVRHLERMPLGTPYPRVGERLAEVVSGVRQHLATATPGRGITTYVDATGVGQPLVDLLKASGVHATACYFTHRDRRIVQEDRGITLGKAWLVSRLQVLLQCGRILLPRTSEADALARELLDFEIKVDQDANEKYGAFRVGAHDDLVTALGLAVQAEPKQRTIIYG
jgi:hypothetical protein